MVQNSTIQSTSPEGLPPALAGEICRFFDLGEPVHSERVSSGLNHANYFVDTRTDTGRTSQYVARILGYHNPDVLGNEQFVQGQLTEAGISTAQLLTTGGDFLYTNGDVHATVSAKLPGKHPDRPATDEHCFLVGQLLAGFHEAVQKLQHGNYKYALLGRESTAYRIGKFKGTPEGDELTNLLRATADDLFDTMLPKRVMHGDLHPQNVLIDGPDAAVLDLETTIIGPRIVDMGRCMLDLCSAEGSLAIDPQKVERFLVGYSDKHPLTAEELAAVPQAIAFGSTALASWCYLKGFRDAGSFYMQMGQQQLS